MCFYGVRSAYTYVVQECICMYVCMYVYVSVCIRIYIYIHVYIYIPTYLHTYIYTYIHTYIHTYTKAFAYGTIPVLKLSAHNNTPQIYTFYTTYSHANTDKNTPARKPSTRAVGQCLHGQYSIHRCATRHVVYVFCRL